ncbi:hypothetical protein Tco_0736414 [Tanacetum coccineum]
MRSIPCSPKCKIVRQILLDHPLSYALTATTDVLVVYLQQFWKTVSKVPKTKDTIRFKLDIQEIMYTVDMFHDTLYLPVETPDNPFIAPVNIEIIESFMNRFGYQGVVDKDVIQYPRFTKLIIADLMKKFPSISLILEEDYHSIKDDIPLIRATDDYKEYEMVFVGVVVPMNQPQSVVSTEGTHKTKPRAHRTPTLTAASPQGKKRKQSVVEGGQDDESYASKFANSMLHDDVDDYGDRIEPRSHNKHPEIVNDDDNEEEKKYEKKDYEMGILEIRTENMQTLIPTPPRSPRIILSSDKNINQELTRVLTIFDRTRMEPTLNDMLSNQFRNDEEYAYHLEQATHFMKNQTVWESRQEDIRRPIPKPLVFYKPQRIPNEPLRYLYNKDLFFLKNGNTEEKKYVLSLHKIHAESFLEVDLEEMMNRWV